MNGILRPAFILFLVFTPSIVYADGRSIDTFNPHLGRMSYAELILFALILISIAVFSLKKLSKMTDFFDDPKAILLSSSFACHDDEGRAVSCEIIDPVWLADDEKFLLVLAAFRADDETNSKINSFREVVKKAENEIRSLIETGELLVVEPRIASIKLELSKLYEKFHADVGVQAMLFERKSWEIPGIH